MAAPRHLEKTDLQQEPQPVRALLELEDRFAAWKDILERICGIVPVPNALWIPLLVETIGRLIERVPWLPDTVPWLADENYSRLRETAKVIRREDQQSWSESSSELQGQKQEETFYGLSALIDDRPLPPEGLEQLRGVWFLCAERSTQPDSDGAHITVLRDLASAIRGARKSQREIFAQWLPILGPADWLTRTHSVLPQ